MIAQAEHIPVHLGAMPDAVAAVMPLGLEPGAGRDPQRPVHGRHAPARRDARLAHRPRLRGLARPPCGRRRDRAGKPSRVLAHARRGGRDPAAAAPHRRRPRALRRGDAATRGAPWRPSRPARPRTGSPSGGSRSCAHGAARSGSPLRWTSSTPTPSGWCAAALAMLPDGAARPTMSSRRSTADLTDPLPVEIAGDAIRIDFAGTAPQYEGNLNCPLAVTKSACYFVVRCLTEPDLPASGGAFARRHRDGAGGLSRQRATACRRRRRQHRDVVAHRRRRLRRVRRARAGARRPGRGR